MGEIGVLVFLGAFEFLIRSLCPHNSITGKSQTPQENSKTKKQNTILKK